MTKNFGVSCHVTLCLSTWLRAVVEVVMKFPARLAESLYNMKTPLEFSAHGIGSTTLRISESVIVASRRSTPHNAGLAVSSRITSSGTLPAAAANSSPSTLSHLANAAIRPGVGTLAFPVSIWCM
jgi:hypothetical protein